MCAARCRIHRSGTYGRNRRSYNPRYCTANNDRRGARARATERQKVLHTDKQVSNTVLAKLPRLLGIKRAGLARGVQLPSKSREALDRQ